jgi:hypothetical protein
LTHNSFSCMFSSILYMFRAVTCPSSGESIVSIWHPVNATLYRWLFGVQVWITLQSHPNLHTKRSSIQSGIYQMSYWYNWFSWRWACDCPKHVGSICVYVGSICVNGGSVCIYTGSVCVYVGSACTCMGSVCVCIGSVCLYGVNMCLYKVNMCLCGVNMCQSGVSMHLYGVSMCVGGVSMHLCEVSMCL